MPRKRPKGIHIEQIGRSQKRTAYYYRVAGGSRIRLPDQYGTEEFWRAYETARDSGVSCRPPPPPRPTSWQKRQEQSIAKLSRSVKEARRRAAKSGAPYDIDEEWVLSEVRRLEFRCAVTSIPFYSTCRAFSRINPYAPSLDRIDPKGGYTKDNVRIVVLALNIMLMDWGHDVFEYVVNRYRWQKGQKVKSLFPKSSTFGTRRKLPNKINA
jgi:hypothetical protein